MDATIQLQCRALPEVDLPDVFVLLFCGDEGVADMFAGFKYESIALKDITLDD